MLIVWGTRRKVERLAVVMLSCPQGHPAAHTVLRVVTRFTLFFVPLFPIRTRYSVQCTLCGLSGSVDREQAEELAASADRQASSPAPPTPQQSIPQQMNRQAGPQQPGNQGRWP